MKSSLRRSWHRIDDEVARRQRAVMRVSWQGLMRVVTTNTPCAWFEVVRASWRIRFVMQGESYRSQGDVLETVHQLVITSLSNVDRS